MAGRGPLVRLDCAFELFRPVDHYRGWDFLTGDREDIDLIRRKLGVFDREDDGNPLLHTGMVVYGNERTGRWRAVYAMAKPEIIVSSVLKSYR
jgi:protein SCO1/2